MRKSSSSSSSACLVSFQLLPIPTRQKSFLDSYHMQHRIEDMRIFYGKTSHRVSVVSSSRLLLSCASPCVHVNIHTHTCRHIHRHPNRFVVVLWTAQRHAWNSSMWIDRSTRLLSRRLRETLKAAVALEKKRRSV